MKKVVLDKKGQTLLYKLYCILEFTRFLRVEMRRTRMDKG